MGVFQRAWQGFKNIFVRQSGIAIINNNNLMRSFLTRTIYNIPEIRTAINTVSETFATIPIYRKRVDNETGDTKYISDRLDYVLNLSPNPYQTKTQFWSFIISKLLLNNAAAVQIVYDDDIRYLVPLPFFRSQPQDDFKTIVFADDPMQKKYAVDEVIILTRFSEFGRGAESHATDMYEKIITAIQQRAIKNTEESRRIVAAVKKATSQMGSRVKNGDAIDAVNDIAAQVAKSDIEGFAYLDGATDIIPLNIPEIRVEKELLAVIIEAVENYFGISEVIIKGTASEIEYQQFVMKLPKFLSEQCQEEFTRKLFTEREYQVGNRIEFDYLALQISTLTAKVALMSNGILNGYLSQDDCREMIGWAPLPDGLGKEYRGNLNSANLRIIDKYQENKATGNGGFTEQEKQIKKYL